MSEYYGYGEPWLGYNGSYPRPTPDPYRQRPRRTIDRVHGRGAQYAADVPGGIKHAVF